jgi:hypothetical protein
MGRMAPRFPQGSRARLICEIAVATSTSPSQWWDATAETLATVLDILNTQAAEVRKARRGR